MTYTPGIGKFHIILPEIGKFFLFHCYLLFFLPLPHIFNIVNNFWVKKQMMQIVLFFVRNFCFDSIGNFSSQIGKKVYVLPLGT
jgi:hypothetical protein